MIKTLFIFFLITTTFSLAGFAQGGAIQGKVADAITNSEINSASILLDDGKKYTTADVLGSFRFLQLAEGRHTLTVSAVGYADQTLTVEIAGNQPVALKVMLAPSAYEMPSVEIRTRNADAIQHINRITVQSRTMNSSQDVLRVVPGLFIGQHAGGGKAEQIFLRGFDMDHGTDIRIEADGLPVNMTSHAHGQGYADLHWIIPELINTVDVFKGPFWPQYGNLATGAAVSLNTVDVLPESFLKLESGSFNTYRTVMGLNLLGKESRGKSDAYVAGEYLLTDSYFDAPQRFNRLNLQAKYKLNIDDNKQLLIGFTTFSSKWNASGQIPDRAVADGSIGFYGAINPNEGGQTSRTNAYIKYKQAISSNTLFEHQLYYSKYDFELYSDFTFFLENPVLGDMIRQVENRNLYGYKNTLSHKYYLGGKKAELNAGLLIQADDIKNSELSYVYKRYITLDSLAFGDTYEVNAGLWISQNIAITSQLSVQAGLRYDHFQFNYLNKLDATPGENNLNTQKAKASPKLSVYYSPSKSVQLYAHGGYGFHSNDARSIVSGNTRQILPAVKGVEIGTITQPIKNLLIQGAFWLLDFDSELVYSGDGAVTEPSNKTKRYGYDISVRYQFAKHFFIENDFTYSHSRDKEAAKGEDYLALAPVYTNTGGLIYRNKKLQAAIRYRTLGDRPANSDYSLTAKGYTITDVNAAYRLQSGLEFSASIVNLFNIEWKETQFETESRLQNESQPVNEIHFTPGTKIGIRAGLMYRF